MLAREIEKIHVDSNFCIETRDKNLTNLTGLDEQINLLEQGIAELEDSFANIKQENLQFSDELEKNKATVDIMKRDFEVKKERKKSYSDQIEMKKKELENIEKNISKFEQVKKSYQESLGEAKTLRGRMYQETGSLEDRVGKLDAEIVTLRAELEKITHNITMTRENEKQNTEKANQIRVSILPRKNELVELEGSVRNLEIHSAKLETELEGMNNRWKERFNCEPPATQDQVLSIREVKEYKRKTAELLQYIEQLGPVDISSIQEYDEVNNRYEFLHNQYSDLRICRKSFFYRSLSYSLLKEYNIPCPRLFC
jgi:chromosome segregation protein